MNSSRLEQLAKELLAGRIVLEDFVARAAGPATADLAEAQLDLDRRRRCGYPEVVFGQGKTVATLAKIFQRQMAERIDVLATRISTEQAAELSPQFPTGRYNPVARTFRIPLAATNGEPATPAGYVAVVTAGTSAARVGAKVRSDSRVEMIALSMKPSGPSWITPYHGPSFLVTHDIKS